MGSWIDRVFQALGIAIGGLCALLGAWTPLLTTLVIFMALDYVTGWLVGAMGKSPKTEGGGLSSKVGWEGIKRKGMICVIVLTATLLDGALAGGAETATRMFQPLIVGYYIGNEGLSILENAGLAGVSFPPWLSKALETIRDKGNSATEGTSTDGKK